MIYVLLAIINSALWGAAFVFAFSLSPAAMWLTGSAFGLTTAILVIIAGGPGRVR